MARWADAEWHGDHLPNKTSGKMYANKGLILHRMCGSLNGTDTWFHNPSAEASAHFGVGFGGRRVQWVDTSDTAWAEAAGNHFWTSVEIEGHTDDDLDAGMIENLAKLYAWGHRVHGWPLQLANHPSDAGGLGYHAMGGVDWGNHPCPKQKVLEHRNEILQRAIALVGAGVQHPAVAHGTPKWWHRTLRVQEPLMEGADVKVVQRKLRITPVDGIYGHGCESKVRGWQELKGLTADGAVGPVTAKKMGD